MKETCVECRADIVSGAFGLTADGRPMCSACIGAAHRKARRLYDERVAAGDGMVVALHDGTRRPLPALERGEPATVLAFPSEVVAVDTEMDRVRRIRAEHRYGEIGGQASPVPMGHNAAGRVLMSIEALPIGSYEGLGKSLEMTPGQAHAVADELSRIAQGVIRLELSKTSLRTIFWARPDGRAVSTGTFEVLIVERVGKRVRVDLVDRERQLRRWRSVATPEPPESMWFDEESGLPEGLKRRRRHWRLGRAPRR